MTKGVQPVQKVPISELKARLSQYVGAAKQGQEIIITERDKPVASLGPIQRPLGDARLIDMLVRFGWGRPAHKTLTDSIVDSGQPFDPKAIVRTTLLAQRRDEDRDNLNSRPLNESDHHTGTGPGAFDDAFNGDVPAQDHVDKDEGHEFEIDIRKRYRDSLGGWGY